MAENFTAYFFTQGFLGIAVLALGIVVIYQNKKLDKKDSRIEELQELRLADSKEVTKDVTEVLQGNSQNMRVLAEKITVGKAQGST